MLKTLFAEELLSLVVARERAGAIAGDLTEEAAKRGPLWFSGALAGAVGAMFFQCFGAARLRTLGLLAAGLALWIGTYVGVRVGGALLGLQAAAAGGTGSPLETAPALVYFGATLAVASFSTGLVLGRIVRPGPPSPVMPLAVFWATVALAAFCADVAAGRPTWYCTLVYLVGVPAFYIVPLVAGGAAAARLGPPGRLEAAR